VKCTKAKNCFSKVILSNRDTKVKLQQDTPSLLPPLSPVSVNKPPKVCGGFDGG